MYIANYLYIVVVLLDKASNTTIFIIIKRIYN
nr:MAG TPA: hypothetical protein [Bacteriophage sp.]DAN56393.1 MAG TPA: hypothetical protein [Bacteriophage sp.]DAY36413.1 MAG TPA: hypothetical protein [Bacteriophage sp.]